MVSQAVPLQPLEINSEADIHLQPTEDPTLKHVQTETSRPDKWTTRQTENFLTCKARKTVISGTTSSWRFVPNGVPHGVMLGPVLFSGITDYLNDGTGHTFGRFVDDMEVGAAADTLHSCVAIQRDTGSLEKWTDRNVMKFNRRKCQVL
ncbi:rna-directed dna polymerase from mobile element jockey- hypothetical protein [Limosa lapponica baueri]|uniref:Reverse transcriptase domain-containing protein n=1 Tax=Limosa lapponica baueri TaxID=1758121 RepID=A0A2I0UPM9_LIMLA|nr:rna-directed dna polymerase from mobile element jockey- hypothetical protein [Limosa lapponica baueri]